MHSFWIRIPLFPVLQSRFVLDFFLFLLGLFDPSGSLSLVKVVSRLSSKLSLDLGMEYIPNPISQSHIDRFILFARISFLSFVRFLLDGNLA